MEQDTTQDPLTSSACHVQRATTVQTPTTPFQSLALEALTLMRVKTSAQLVPLDTMPRKAPSIAHQCLLDSRESTLALTTRTLRFAHKELTQHGEWTPVQLVWMGSSALREAKLEIYGLTAVQKDLTVSVELRQNAQLEHMVQWREESLRLLLVLLAHQATTVRLVLLTSN